MKQNKRIVPHRTWTPVKNSYHRMTVDRNCTPPKVTWYDLFTGQTEVVDVDKGTGDNTGDTHNRICGDK